MKRSIRAVPALVAGTLFFACAALAGASTTIHSGTKILCVIASGVDSSAVRVGSDFKLVVDDPNQPALKGAIVHGHVTDVSPPAGLNRARIGFHLDYIHFHDGTREPIRAELLAKNVTQYNTAAARQEAIKFSLPPMPNGTRTPGPVAWQLNLGENGSASVTPPPTGSVSGYVYAANSNETIVIPPGSPVTIKLTSSLAAP